MDFRLIGVDRGLTAAEVSWAVFQSFYLYRIGR